MNHLEYLVASPRASMELPPKDGRKVINSTYSLGWASSLQWSYRPKTVESPNSSACATALALLQWSYRPKTVESSSQPLSSRHVEVLQWSYRPKTVERTTTRMPCSCPERASMELPPKDGRKKSHRSLSSDNPRRLQWSYRPKTVERISASPQSLPSCRLQWSYRPKTVESPAIADKVNSFLEASMELPPKDGRKGTKGAGSSSSTGRFNGATAQRR